MKNIFYKTAKGGKTPVKGVLALFIGALFALGGACGGNTVSNTGSGGAATTGSASIPPPPVRADASKVEMPAEDELQYLTKATMLDFNDAVQKGDFSDFHSKMSQNGQKLHSPEKLKQQFAIFTEKGVDLNGISSAKAEFSQPPGISPGKIMKMLLVQGRYNISPAPVTFELKFIPEGNEWKLYGIDVQTGNTQK